MRYIYILFAFYIQKFRNYILRWMNIGFLSYRNNKYYVNYTDDVGIIYTIVWNKKRGPCNFERVEDEKNTDVTNEIRKYAGICHNFHGIQTTPVMLGYDKLKFVTREKKVLDFEGKNVIQV